MKIITYGSLILLTIQNASHILLMRYCRTKTADLFFTSSVIIVTEIVKLLISLFMCCYLSGLKGLYRDTFDDFKDSIKVVIPAIIYVIQNNLLYISLENLDSATFQVTYQLKLLTTAIFSVMVLRRYISRLQWLSLLLLFIGVAIVQLDPSSTTKAVARGLTQNRLVGMGAVLTACVLSGFAGIYFEMILKSSNKSLWARNVLLAVIGTVCCVAGQLATERQAIATKGFFHGFDWYTLLLIILQSVGGILVAVVVKYHSQVLKGFACSASIVISILMSVFMFNTEISGIFLLGAGLVVISIVLYNSSSPCDMATHQQTTTYDKKDR